MQTAFYVGYTARRLEDEALRFLTMGGASECDEDGNYSKPEKRNRPVLLWSDDSTITMTNAQTELGFTVFERYMRSRSRSARATSRTHCSSTCPFPGFFFLPLLPP